MTAPIVLDHDNAVLAAVKTVGRPTDLAKAPDGALDALLVGVGLGYFIVYPIGGGHRDGPVADPYADIALHYQITCVDRGPEGARWLSDRLEPALSGLTVPNRSVMSITPTAPSGIWPDDDTAAQRLYLSTPSFKVWTTP